MLRFTASQAILALSATVLSTGALHAAEIAAASKVDAVTVFPDGALVARAGSASLPAGSHLLVLKGLPQGIDPASLRFEAMGDAALVIGTVESRLVPASTAPNSEAQAKVRRLRGELAGVLGRVDAVEAEKRAIERLTQLAAEAAAKTDKGFDVAQAKAAWQAVGAATAEANEILRQLRAQGADLEAEIKAIELTEARMRPALQPRMDVTISMEAARDTKADFRLSYTVKNARWSPVYDAQLLTNAAQAKLSLIRRADVTQASGEDWSDVQLTLSTTRVRRGTAAPEVNTQSVNLFDPALAELQERQRQMTRRSGNPAFEAAPAAPAPMAAAKAVEDRVEAVQQEASVEVSAFSAAFVAPGRLSVTGDGARKSVRLASREIDPELVARVSPAFDTTAYLSASFLHGEDAPLLAGEVNLTRDGTYVGKGRLAFVASGDRVELGFGADDRIKVERVPVRKRDNDPSWASSSRTQLVDMKTTLTNLHQRPMKVQLRDRLPVPENTAITVEILKETTPPTEKQVGDRRGVMGWNIELKPSEAREIRLAWRMKWPADREIVVSP